jgi:hypothetical protein
MALHGLVSSNLSPIFFKGSDSQNSNIGINLIIHYDESGSMTGASRMNFYTSGTIIQEIQKLLLLKNIGNNYEKYPNLYGYFGQYRRDPQVSFSITNDQGTLNISQAFMRGVSSTTVTKNTWSNGYVTNINSLPGRVNVCTDIIGQTTGGRLKGSDQDSEDVHGNLWSLYTTPNTISSGISGVYGTVISSSVRQNCPTFVITNSDEQDSAGGDMINQLVAVNSSGTQERIINGATGELVFRGYRIIALSSYTSSDGYDGILFYGNSAPQPYGYVGFASSDTYTITKSSTAPSSWVKDGAIGQIHNTLTLASDTNGAIFKLDNVYGSSYDNREAFAKVLVDFISETITP